MRGKEGGGKSGSVMMGHSLGDMLHARLAPLGLFAPGSVLVDASVQAAVQ